MRLRMSHKIVCFWISTASILLAASLTSARVQAAEESDTQIDLKETHLGVELDMMPGGPEQGSMLPFFIVTRDHFMASLGGNLYHFNDKLQGITHFWQGEARLAYRMDLASWTYLDTGWDYSWQWGTQTGAPMGTNYSTGPMLGLTRQFPHTGFFFTAFVVVAQYIHVNAPNASTPSNGTGWGFFENGGVGVRYLF